MPKEDKTNVDDKSKGSGDEKSFTQAELDDIVKDRLKREKAKYADYDDLKAKAEAADAAAGKDKSDAEKLTEQMAKMQKDLDSERVMRLRAEVAADKGLTPAQAKRLSGTSKEELETDADELLEAFPAPAAGDAGKGAGGSKSGPPSKRPTPDLKGGIDPTEETEKVDPKELADAIPRP